MQSWCPADLLTAANRSAILGDIWYTPSPPAEYPRRYTLSGLTSSYNIMFSIRHTILTGNAYPKYPLYRVGRHRHRDEYSRGTVFASVAMRHCWAQPVLRPRCVKQWRDDSHRAAFCLLSWHNIAYLFRCNSTSHHDALGPESNCCVLVIDSPPIPRMPDVQVVQSSDASWSRKERQSNSDLNDHIPM